MGGKTHVHIARLKAIDAATNTPYEGSREAWVAEIEKGNTGFVHDRYGNEIGVYVNHNGYVKWVQTYADGVWTDNLLALPRY